VGVFERSLGPDVEFQDLGVGFEPVPELVFWSEDGPMLREVDVREMVVPDRVVEDELMVSISPIIADTGIAVDDEGLDSQLLEPCSGSQTCLSGAFGDMSVYCGFAV